MHKRSILWVGVVFVLIVAVGLGVSAKGKSGGWTQWGGPDQEFRAKSDGLAKTWGEDGPPELWSRELGDGYSAILVDEGRLYTMYRGDGQEHVICMKADDGSTVWEFSYDAAPKEGHVAQFGEGPRSTPLISGDLIYTVGVAGDLHALDKKTGKPVWQHDLWDEFDGTFLNHGYSSSPIEHDGRILVLSGGEGQSIIAFDRKTGEVEWKSGDFANSYSTPRVLELAGRTQLVAFMAEEVVGLDAGTGDVLWSYPHQNQWQQNITLPIKIDDDRLFVSSPQAGAKGLRLTVTEDGFAVEEIWSTRKIQFYHVNTVRNGDYVYGSTGTMAPAFMAALNIKTGEIAWRKRGYAKANCVAADGRLFILDEDGVLYLTTATPDDLVLHSQVELLDDVAWTVPTIVGKTMFVRDKRGIVALDLG
jgi:outer membrane protein assembly factor BamB